jgi:CubicO group peptidase (beta-lactamase class C family)
MRLLALAVAALAGCTQAHAVPPGASVPGEGDLSSVLEPIRAEADLPALAGAIVDVEGIRHVGVVGVRRYGDPTPAHLGDPFHLGSDTKAMTALVIGAMVDQGKLAFTTTIAQAFPEQAADMNPAFRDVTIDMLLAHRGGFPKEEWPGGKSADDIRGLPGTPREKREAFVRLALHDSPASKPGEYLYSNAGYTVAAVMAERAANASWEDLVTRVVFEPLGMKGAGFGPMGTEGEVDAPWQHYRVRGEVVAVGPGPSSDNPIAIAPSGRVHLPIEAWGRFVVDQLRSFEGRGAIARPETYEHLHTPLFGGDYVGGWIVTSRPWGGRVYTHAGSNRKNYAVVWMAPEKRFAVLVATNMAGDRASKACDKAVDALIRMSARAP